MEIAQLSLLKKIMEIEFFCIDLNLYLDTHCQDQKAVQDYNFYSEQLNNLKKQYENFYGPLSVFGYSKSQFPWRWVDDPWPWEIEY
ncbi:MAG: spore coat protein CotJB [Minisyncoccia bacterium]